MTKHNFKNPTTGETFLISNFITKFNGGNLWHIDKKTRERLKDKDGTVLEPITYSGDVQAPSIKTPTKNRV